MNNRDKPLLNRIKTKTKHQCTKDAAANDDKNYIKRQWWKRKFSKIRTNATNYRYNLYNAYQF